MVSPSRKLDQLLIRLPDGMRQKLEAAAQTNHRSVTAEVVARLEASFSLVDDIRTEGNVKWLMELERMLFEVDPMSDGFAIEDLEELLTKIYSTTAISGEILDSAATVKFFLDLLRSETDSAKFRSHKISVTSATISLAGEIEARFKYLQSRYRAIVQDLTSRGALED